MRRAGAPRELIRGADHTLPQIRSMLFKVGGDILDYHIFAEFRVSA